MILMFGLHLEHNVPTFQLEVVIPICDAGAISQPRYDTNQRTFIPFTVAAEMVSDGNRTQAMR